MEQEAYTELIQLRNWIESKQCPSADELSGLGGKMKSIVQHLDQILIREGVLVIRRHDDPEQELTIVPSSRVEHIIRFYHDRPGEAHQAPKATSAKIISCFWWPDLRRDVRLYVACSQSPRGSFDSTEPRKRASGQWKLSVEEIAWLWV